MFAGKNNFKKKTSQDFSPPPQLFWILLKFREGEGWSTDCTHLKGCTPVEQAFFAVVVMFGTLSWFLLLQSKF